MSYHNQSREAMLAVKRGMELQVSEYIDYYTRVDATDRQRVTLFFDAIERHVAALFVARQIDNNYLVRSLESRGLEIKFSTKGHATAITFMLPPGLCWTVKKMINQVAPKPSLTFVEACEASAQKKPVVLETVEDVEAYLNEQDRKDWRAAAIESHDRYVAKTITEDYISQAPGTGRGSLVTTLPGGENLDEIDSVFLQADTKNSGGPHYPLPRPHVTFIDIGDMPKDKVEAYLESIRVEIRAKKMPVSNEQLSRDAYDKAMKVVG